MNESEYMSPSSLQVETSSEVARGVPLFATTAADDDGLYMTPVSHSAAAKAPQIGRAAIFPMVDMSALAASATEVEVSREVVTPPASSDRPPRIELPGFASRALESKDPSRNLSSATKLEHEAGRLVTPTFRYSNGEEETYVTAENATSSPTFRRDNAFEPQRSLEEVSREQIEELRGIQQIKAEERRSGGDATETAQRGSPHSVAHSIVWIDVTEAATENNNCAEAGESRYLSAPGTHNAVYLDFTANGAGDDAQAKSRERHDELLMGGKSSKKKLFGTRATQRAANQNVEAEFVTTVTNPDGTVSAVKMRKQRSSTSVHQLSAAPSSARPVSMPFEDPPTPPLSPSPFAPPGLGPLPPTPRENRPASVPDTRDEEAYEPVDGKSSMPKEPPPLPPSLSKPPPFPRTSSNVAPKLPYRPPTSKLLPNQQDSSSPQPSPLKKPARVLLPRPDQAPPSKTNIRASDEETIVTNQSKSQGIEDSIAPRGAKVEEKPSTPMKKLHPIAEMLKKRQNSGESPLASAQARGPSTEGELAEHQTPRKSPAWNKYSQNNPPSPAEVNQKDRPPPIPDTSYRLPGVGAAVTKPQQIVPSQKATMKDEASVGGKVVSVPNLPILPSKLRSPAPMPRAQRATFGVQSKPSPPPNKPSPARKPSNLTKSPSGDAAVTPSRFPKKPELPSTKFRLPPAGESASNISSMTDSRKPAPKPPPKASPAKSFSENDSPPSKTESTEERKSFDASTAPSKLARRKSGGYTLHKLQAERLAALEDPDEYTVSVTCMEEQLTDDFDKVFVRSPSAESEEEEDNTYHSIDVLPGDLDEDRRSGFLQAHQLKTSRSTSVNSFPSEHPEAHPAKEAGEKNISLSHPKPDVRSPKIKRKPRPTAPPPPRPDAGNNPEEKQKTLPSRPPPPSKKKILEAKMRRDVSRAHSDRLASTGSIQSSPQHFMENLPPSQPNQFFQARCHRHSSPDVSSVTSDDEAMYSAIPDGSSGSGSVTSEDMRFPESKTATQLANKKKRNKGAIAISVSVFASKLGRSKLKAKEETSKGQEPALKREEKWKSQLPMRPASDSSFEEGIYAGIDDEADAVNGGENNNVYLTSLPGPHRAVAGEVAYAELDHGHVSDDFLV